jgi:hypothetical protein
VIVIVIAGGAVADAVREAVREVTVVAIPAAADAAEGKISSGSARLHSLRKSSRRDGRLP